MDLISTSNLADISPKTIVMAATSFIFLIFVGITIVLLYHWKRYGIHKTTVILITIIYLAVSSILLYSLFQAGLAIINQ